MPNMSIIPERALPQNGVRVRFDSADKNKLLLSTASEFFDQEVQIVFGNGKVCFKAVTLSFTGRTYRPHKQGNGYRICMVSKGHFPEGEYAFDVDESNEDIKVVYLEDVRPLYNRKKKATTHIPGAPGIVAL